MSRSVDLFISTPEPLDQVATEVGRLIGRGLARMADPDRWLLEEDGVAAVLAAHPYADDGNLFFSHYRYALSARVGNSSRPQDSAEAALLRRVAHRLQSGSKWPVLLVLDLQYRDRDARDEGAGQPPPADQGEPRGVPGAGEPPGPTVTAPAPPPAEPTGAPAPAPPTEPAGGPERPSAREPSEPAAVAAPAPPAEPPAEPSAPSDPPDGPELPGAARPARTRARAVTSRVVPAAEAS